MIYQLNCPNCGKRAVSEFTFRSEYLKRPAPDADFSVWADYVYFRENNMGRQTEWWYHRSVFSGLTIQKVEKLIEYSSIHFTAL